MPLATKRIRANKSLSINHDIQLILCQDVFGSNILHAGLHADKSIEALLRSNDKYRDVLLGRLCDIHSRPLDFLDLFGWDQETTLQNS